MTRNWIATHTCISHLIPLYELHWNVLKSEFTLITGRRRRGLVRVERSIIAVFKFQT